MSMSTVGKQQTGAKIYAFVGKNDRYESSNNGSFSLVCFMQVRVRLLRNHCNKAACSQHWTSMYVIDFLPGTKLSELLVIISLSELLNNQRALIT